MKVAFFPGCMVDMFYPEVGIAAVNVLERLGCEVMLPDDQVCCGQPFSNSGYIEEAKPMMRKVVDAYSGYDTIVSLTGSCAWAIKAEYPHFFADDPIYSKKIAELAPGSMNSPSSSLMFWALPTWEPILMERLPTTKAATLRACWEWKSSRSSCCRTLRALTI